MPVHATSRADLRERARDGDVRAAFALIERARIKTLKGLLAQVCSFEHPVTPAIFDCVADAWALWETRQEILD